METIADYSILENIDETKHSLVYRGQRPDDNETVIIKVLKSDNPTSSEIAKLRQEYEIIRSIDIEGVIGVHDILSYEGGCALILEDFNGISLKTLLKEQNFNNGNMKTFLRTGVKLAETLGNLHMVNIVHKDIKPHNILINQMNHEVKLADFGISSMPSLEQNSSEAVSGTLPYMSPEQTGRINRNIDYRTDLYSLGITFYEMLTGQVPFQSEDPMEIIHSHIAKTPPDPAETCPDISGTVSGIVMKLLSKNPEERYQNSFGLAADLQECLSHLERNGSIGSFKLASKDTSLELCISPKLFGRENEIEQILSAFENTCSGVREIMMISGHPGIGKSAIVNEIQKSVLEKQALFVFGKFEQFGGNVPYSSIIEAFQRLIHQLLSENEEKIAYWKEQISDALGPNGKLISDVLPDIELIIGPQPDLPELGPEKSQNRFTKTFVDFVRVFAWRDHPMVLFMDDLQWADPASLHLLKNIITDSETGYLFMIGAYRDNDLNSSPLLVEMLDELKNENVWFNTLPLGPLRLGEVNSLIADILKCEEEYSLSLAKEVHGKTEGNPFFVSRFLEILYENRLVELNSEWTWQWDIEKIRETDATDNVLDMMTNKITRLGKPAQELLGICACLGNRFDIGTLCSVSGMSADYVLNNLDEAIIEGFIGISRNSYAFQHDRIHEAAYATVTEDKKKDWHYRIGKDMLEKTGKKEMKDRVIHIINQINMGLEGNISQVEDKERTDLARLNLMAGQKAKNSIAYESANQFMRKGLEFLPESAWESEYELCMSLHSASGETEYLTGSHQQAEHIFNKAMKHARNSLDKIDICHTRMIIYNVSNRSTEALQMGMNALKNLGFPMPARSGKLKVIKEIIRAKMLMRNKNVEDLANLSELTDIQKLSVSRILMGCTVPSYIQKPDYLPIFIFKILNLSLEYGNSKYAPYAYATYSVLLCDVLGNIPMGERFGKLAMNLLDKFDTSESKSKIHMIYGAMVNHWTNHIRESFDYFAKGYKHGIETGDYEFASYNLGYHAFYSFISGRQLEKVRKRYEKYHETMKQLGQPVATQAYEIFYQMVSNLSGEAENKLMISGDICDEGDIIPLWIQSMGENGRITNMGQYLFCKLIVFCIYGKFEKAVETADEVEKYLDVMIGQVLIAEYYFYRSIALLAVYHDADRKTRKKYLKQVKTGQKKMKQWAEHAPMNFLNKYYLVEAELSRILGESDKAMEYYDRAIEGARENRFHHEEALACELAAKFYLEKDRFRIARIYMQSARYSYDNWGAVNKVGDLEERYKELLKTEPGADSATSSWSTSNSVSGTLDFSSLLKSSNAMFGETDLEKLLGKIIELTLENGGAQKAMLILENEEDKQLYIQAKAETDRDIQVFQSVPVSGSDLVSPAVVNYVKRTKENVILDNAAEKGMFANDPYIVRNKSKSVLCGPAMYKGIMYGILYLENNLTVNAFPPERLEILRVLSSQAAISIENSLLIKHREDSATIRKEMEIAANIQTGLVPANPEIGGFDISAYISPADDVGGDYYDVINGKDRDWVVIGDVCGHGVSSGLVMMMVQTSIRITLDNNPQISPSGLLTVINRTITENILKMKEDKHMTITVFALYKDGKVEFSGLHEDILIYRAGTSDIETVETKGMWIGLIDDVEGMMTDDEFYLDAGDTMLLYTDGITESMPKKACADPETQLFGDERLVEILSRGGECSCEDIRTDILNSLEDYNCDDDVTMVVLKRLPGKSE